MSQGAFGNRSARKLPAAVVLACLLAYRVIYYFFPLAIGAALLGAFIHDFDVFRQHVRQGIPYARLIGAIGESQIDALQSSKSLEAVLRCRDVGDGETLPFGHRRKRSGNGESKRLPRGGNLDFITGRFS